MSSPLVPHWSVKVYLYDISQGMARAMSLPFLGKHIDGIWHTGLVVYGHEYFYGGGIQASPPGMTMAGRPTQIIDIGFTHKTQAEFHTWLRSVSHRFTPNTYSLLSHNCNNFTDAACMFLTNSPIPAHITGLPEDALNTPMGQMLKPMLQNMESQMKGSQGGGMIPWSEQLLDLPRSSSNADTHRAVTITTTTTTNPSSSTTTTTTTATVSTSSSTPLSPSSSSSSSSKVSGAAPLLANSVIVSDLTDHPHAALTLTSLSNRVSPLLSSDTKIAAFYALIKTANNKIPTEHQLTDADKQVLDECVKALSSSASTPLSSSVLPLFDRLLSSWPLDKLFAVLAIYRLLLLRDDIIKTVESRPLTQYDRMIEVVEKNETDDKAKIPLAAKIMALCCLSNLFTSPKLGQQCASHGSFTRVSLSSLQNVDQALRLMGATLLYNIIISTAKSDDNENLIEILLPLTESILKETDTECVHRMLLSLANLIYANNACSLVLMSMEVDFNPIKTKFQGGSTNVVNAKIQALLSDIHTVVEADRQRSMD